jgi:F-type H+-transporting ATPase subunit alpha
MHVADQVIQIFTVVNAFLDDVDIDDIQRFESELLEFVINARPEVRTELIEKLQLDEGLEKKLKEAIGAFKRTFASTAVLKTGETADGSQRPVEKTDAKG